MEMILRFFLIALKQVNAVVVVTISIIHSQNCVPDVVKNLNVKVLNLVSGTNETRCTEWHETCKCKSRFEHRACKQRWNDNKCRCECKELIHKGICDKGLFPALVIVSINVTNPVVLVSI